VIEEEDAFMYNVYVTVKIHSRSNLFDSKNQSIMVLPDVDRQNDFWLNLQLKAVLSNVRRSKIFFSLSLYSLNFNKVQYEKLFNYLVAFLFNWLSLLQVIADIFRQKNFDCQNQVKMVLTTVIGQNHCWLIFSVKISFDRLWVLTVTYITCVIK
jgi:hypothetical protein